MWKTDDLNDEAGPEYEFEPTTYESFMRKHLQHYGYYTGRNQGYRHDFKTFEEWEKTHCYELSSDELEDTDSDLDDDDDDDLSGKHAVDSKFQEELLRTTQLIYSYEAGRLVPRLREPRNLYALAKELGPQQAARWPSDAQVVRTRIKHIRYVPPEPENFYQPTGIEKTPMVRDEENGGRLVYQYETKGTFFIQSRVGGTRNGASNCSVPLVAESDTTLIFESRFESANLAKVIQTSENDYELWLRYDHYTNKHTQWFYFQVANAQPGRTYRFTIVNFMKPDSLYNSGMKPLMYSEKEAQRNKVGWVRSGSQIKYYRNNKTYTTSKGEKPFYSLTWTAECAYENDIVYFAHCYPYTYSDLQDYLLAVANDPIKSKICKQRVLCRTLAGNLVYILTITSPSQNPQDIKHKKAVVLTSRVHPGESNASWMMKGFLDYLTGNSTDAKLLRDTFIFKIVPMLNPDGVIVGNYRCSLSGRDLNRNYKTMLKDSFPSVWHTKNMIRRVHEEHEIAVYCDLHGHSRKQNVFIYGCENRNNNNRRLRERIFPMMLHKNAPDKFSFDSCKFKIQKSKEGTGRIVMWNMGILNSFTMEATFCGSSLGKKKGRHFSVVDFESLGYHFCDTLLDYCDPDGTKVANIYLDLEERVKLEILARLEKQGVSTENIDLNEDYISVLESTDEGSNSSGSDGLPIHLQYISNQTSKKKKKLRSRKERDRQRLVQEEAKKTDPMSAPADDSRTGDKQSSQHGQNSQSLREKRPSRHQVCTSTHRPSSRDDRINGIPVFIQERCETRYAQRQNDYLEALTHTYLQNGMILGPESAVPHLRYSGNKLPALPFTLEGLCPHHEQTFAAQYMNHHLRNLQYPVTNMLALVGYRLKCQERRKPVSSCAGRVLRRVQSEDNTRMTRPVPGGESTIEEFIRAHMNAGSGQNMMTLDRLPPQRNLVEITTSHHDQSDYLIEDSNIKGDSTSGRSSPIKQHPPPFDSTLEHRKSDVKRGKSFMKTKWPRSRAPSATSISYEWTTTAPSITKVVSQPAISTTNPGLSQDGCESSSKLSGDPNSGSDVCPPRTSSASLERLNRKTSAKLRQSARNSKMGDLDGEARNVTSNLLTGAILADIPRGAGSERRSTPTDQVQDSTDRVPSAKQVQKIAGRAQSSDQTQDNAGRVQLTNQRLSNGGKALSADELHASADGMQSSKQLEGSGEKVLSAGAHQQRANKSNENKLQSNESKTIQHSASQNASSFTLNLDELKISRDLSSENKNTDNTELKHLLATSASKTNLSPTASHYINRLMQEANNEIEELTTQLEEHVERERKLVHRDNSSSDGRPSKHVLDRRKGNSAPTEPGDVEAHGASTLRVTGDANTNAVRQSSATSNSSKEETGSKRDSPKKSARARSTCKRELTGALPAKISLMIGQDHRESRETQNPFAGQFLPISRSMRPPNLRHNTKKN